MDRLDTLEAESIHVLREAYRHFDKVGMLWSIGKDSTVLVWLAMKAFYGHVPFTCIHVDTTFKFPEMYAFRKAYAEKWDLNLLVHTNQEALDKGINYDNNDALTVCHELKTEGLKQVMKKEKFDGLILGIRGDEDGSRGKERMFSERGEDFSWDYTDQAPELWDQYKTQLHKGNHMRIHPILNWTELDIWRYIKREEIPLVDLYFAKDGKRYRSLGCMPITHPVDSDAQTVSEIIDELQKTTTTERSGRGQDQEDNYALLKLRAQGYM